MAQLVARLVRNEKVGGSNPPSSTTGRHPIRMSVFCMPGVVLRCRAARCARGRRPARSPSAPRASLGASSRSPARPRRRPRAPQPGTAATHRHRGRAPPPPTGTAARPCRHPPAPRPCPPDPPAPRLEALPCPPVPPAPSTPVGPGRCSAALRVGSLSGQALPLPAGTAARPRIRPSRTSLLGLHGMSHAIPPRLVRAMKS